MVIAGAPANRLSSWRLGRKLSGRTTAEIASAWARHILLRLLAAGCALVSMVLAAWIGALARAVFLHGWAGPRTLGSTALADASARAGHVEASLVPVLVVWAALLLLAPTGYTIAFRAATTAAAALGALELRPPSFAVTPAVSGAAQDLVRATRSWDAAWLLGATMVVAYLAHYGALYAFYRLDVFSVRRPVRPARVACFALALIALLAAAWSGTVIWLAASPDAATAYGLRGALVVSDYLVALIVVAVLVAGSRSPQRWLLATTALASALGALAGDSPLPHDLVVSVDRAGLERITDVAGAGALWAALLLGFPVCLACLYLIAPTRR